MKTCNLYLHYAGYCKADASHAVRDDKPRAIAFKALVGLIEHPELGWILFDTGYTRRFFDATKNFPNAIYARVTRVYITETEEMAYQLQQQGISPASIQHIIISHFHADHIGGLGDFPNAKFYCSKTAWTHVQSTPGAIAFSRGILKSLIPPDFSQRVKFIEDISTVHTDAIWGKVYDLFQDDSILVFEVPGHAAGQIGIRLKTPTQTCLLAADACWDKRAYQQLALPHPIVRVFFHSWKAYKQSLQKLHRYHRLYPDHLILPTHCAATTDQYISFETNRHAL